MSQPANSTGLLTASAVVTAKPARLVSLVAIADGTNIATITVYDNASAASGTELAQIIIPAGSRFNCFQNDDGVMANAGLYVSISGTGAKAIVHFKAGS